MVTTVAQLPPGARVHHVDSVPGRDHDMVYGTVVEPTLRELAAGIPDGSAVDVEYLTSDHKPPPVCAQDLEEMALIAWGQTYRRWECASDLIVMSGLSADTQAPEAK